jgi:hypothetical protein
LTPFGSSPLELQFFWGNHQRGKLQQPLWIRSSTILLDVFLDPSGLKICEFERATHSICEHRWAEVTFENILQWVCALFKDNGLEKCVQTD